MEFESKGGEAYESRATPQGKDYSPSGVNQEQDSPILKQVINDDCICTPLITYRPTISMAYWYYELL